MSSSGILEEPIFTSFNDPVTPKEPLNNPFFESWDLLFD